MLLNFRKYRIILVLVVLSLQSCFDTLSNSELDGYIDKLVVNGVLTQEEAFSFQLTNSKSSVGNELPKLVYQNTKVELNQNGITIPMTFDLQEEIYTSTAIPKPGDVFDLRVTSSGYQTITARTKIPATISATSKIIEEGGVDNTGILSDLLTTTFTDDGTTKNYYLINFFYFNTTFAEFVPMTFTINDPSLADYNSFRLNNNSVLFDDELFNGKTKTLSTVAPYGLVLSNPNEKYLIQLESISADQFKYLSSLQRARDAGEVTFRNSFNDAVVIYSNIVNGVGILGASYAEKDTLY